MARAKNQGNGRVDRLEEALATLIQNQAIFVTQQAATNARIAELERISSERFARIEERFVRIDERFARVENILLEHNRILEGLREAVREKIGFKGA